MVNSYKSVLSNLTSEKTNVLFLLLALPLLGACNKYESCDNAYVCVTNIGSTDIPYAWNSNGLGDTLKPGATTCVDVGEYKGDPNDEIGSYIDFVTDGPTWTIKTTSCLTLKEIEY